MSLKTLLMLHLSLEDAKRLLDVIVSNEYLHACCSKRRLFNVYHNRADIDSVDENCRTNTQIGERRLLLPDT